VNPTFVQAAQYSYIFISPIEKQPSIENSLLKEKRICNFTTDPLGLSSLPFNFSSEEINHRMSTSQYKQQYRNYFIRIKYADTNNENEH